MKHITFAIGSLYGGGAERVVSTWASALAERGYRISIVVYSRLENEYPVSEKVEIYPIASSEKECNEFSMFKRMMLIRSLLKKLKPDAVISFLPVMQVYVAFASFGLGIKRVETIRINPWKTELLNTRFAKPWLWCFDSCYKLILQSEDQKAFFKKKVQNKSVVIPNPVNKLYIDNKKIEYNSDSHTIVAAGRLSEQKNYKMMIDALKLVSEKYSDVNLSIYGVGELEEQLGSYIKEAGLENNVRLMGRSNELYNVYKDADLYVMSSDYEGMPNALAEAMAIGLPCISTDCKTGPRDLMDDGENGFLIPCGDSQALADRIVRIFEMTSDEQEKLGQSARRKIQNFCSEENSLNRLIGLIEEI